MYCHVSVVCLLDHLGARKKVNTHEHTKQLNNNNNNIFNENLIYLLS